MSVSFDKVIFGRFEIDVPAREMRADGVKVKISAKGLEFLCILIDRQGHVVDRVEIAQTLWKENKDSLNLLAKTLVAVRHVIGEKVGDSKWIETVRTRGYRFVGQVIFPQATRPSGFAAGNRLAILPVSNQTGNADLDWTELGLMSSIQSILKKSGRFETVPAGTVVACLSSADGAATLVEKAALVGRMLKVDSIVGCTLSTEDNYFTLSYESFGLPATISTGKVSAEEPLKLAERLAARLNEAPFAGVYSSLQFNARDPFAVQAFARAQTFHAQRRWQFSVNCLRVCLDCEPSNTVAKLLLVSCYARLGDRSAFSIGNELLELASKTGDRRLEALTHAELAGVKDDAQRVDSHFDSAVKLSEVQNVSDLNLRVRMLQGNVACRAKNLKLARFHYEWVLKSATSLADGNWRAKTLVNMAILELELGTKEMSKSYFLLALEACKILDAKHITAYSLAGLALNHADSGEFEEAKRLLIRADHAVAGCEDADMRRTLLEVALAVHGELADAQAVERVLQHWSRVQLAGTQQCFVYLVLKARSAALQGDMDGAVGLTEKAIDAAPHHLYQSTLKQMWVQMLRFELQRLNWHRIGECISKMDELFSVETDDQLRAEVMHAHAARKVRLEPLEALAELQLAISILPLERRSSGRIRMDAAWLATEHGDGLLAQRLVGPVQSWLVQHPIGCALMARIHFSRNEHAAAVAAQHRCLSFYMKGLEPKFLRDMLQFYERAGRTRTGHPANGDVAVPLLDVLPSQLHYGN